ncbi:TPA: hypothetical protein ACTYIX_004489 [Enterobacter hormaechei]|uniref:hypothetical protein n=1 Tax=Enterobacter hormaechei TaxID=158836 RepID=UPI003D6E1706
MKTFTIGWLNKCRCGNKSHSVKTARGNESALWDDDAVKCNSCGRGGVIQVCEGQARVLWETDEEMAEGKPMSTITKERIANLLQFNSEGSNCQANAEQWEVHELARIALASLEAEAVGEVVLGEFDDCGCHPDARVACIAADGQADWENFKDGTRLYTAPPAPVSVPAAMEMDDNFDSAFEHGKAVGWNAYRAAMLQGADGTLTNEGTIPVTQFKPVADLYGLTSPTGGETSFTFDAVEARDFIDGGWLCQEYVELERFQEAVSGNSPVIPDGWVLVPEEPTHEMLEAGDEQFGTYDVYRRMIAASPQQEVKP